MVLQETIFLSSQLLHHPSFYRMLYGREDGGSEEEVDEVDYDQEEDTPRWAHHAASPVRQPGFARPDFGLNWAFVICNT